MIDACNLIIQIRADNLLFPIVLKAIVIQIEQVGWASVHIRIILRRVRARITRIAHEILVRIYLII